MDLKLGDRVLVYGRKLGILKFVGTLKGNEIFCGIELEKKNKGNTDGSFQGKRLFTCPPNQGIFVRAKYVRKFDKIERSAVIVQAQLRGFVAQRKVATKLASRAWNVLDSHNEEMNIRRGKAIASKSSKAHVALIHPSDEAAIAQEMADVSITDSNSNNNNNNYTQGGLGVMNNNMSIPPLGGPGIVSSEPMEGVDDGVNKVLTAAERVLALAEREVSELTEASLESIKLSSNYKGPHLRLPFKLESILHMMEEFKANKVLHYKYIMLLFLLCRRIFNAEQTVQEINIPENCRLTIVGDTHGQLEDLYTIFSIKGIPSATNWYLFNGDFVDRGIRGCEVLATMCAFKILYPQYVFLNRGNHEARAQNAWMGFEEEILSKYTKEPNVVAGDRRSALRLHLLCEYMFDALPLCAVIQKKVFVCHGGLFRNDGVTLKHLRNIVRKREPPLEGRSLEDRIYEDLLWSDPRPTPQYPRALNMRQPSDRGAGCEFGPGVTNQFCANNQIALVVRSHECVPEGYEVLHNGRLITIFSASRYCGTQTNKGAFISFGPDLQPEIQQFFAQVDLEVQSFISEEERHQRLEDDTVHMIIEQICDKRIDLYWYFTKNDVGDNNNNTSTSVLNTIGSSSSSSVGGASTNLSIISAKPAKNPTGRVSRVEWATALQNVLGLDLPFLHYQPRLAELELDGSINYSRFLSRFQIQFRSQDVSWQDAIVQRICEKLYSLCGADLESAYKRFDADKSGVIDYAEFVKTLKGLDVGLNDQQIYELMRSVDVDDSACIDFQEFANRFETSFNTVVEKKKAATSSSSSYATSSSVSPIHHLKSGSSLSSSSGTTPLQPLFQRQSSSEALNVVFRSPSTPRNNIVKLRWENLDTWTLECLRTLSRTMYKKYNTLPVAFGRFDKGAKGYIIKEDFINTLKNDFGLGFSDQDAGKLFEAVDTNSSGRINYWEFLGAFQITDLNPQSDSWKQGVIQQIANVLYQNRIHLRNAFRMFDVEGTGRVTTLQFQTGMHMINDMLEHPLSPIQIEELRRSLDKDGNGEIDYKDFFDTFFIFDTESIEKPHLIRKSSSFFTSLDSSKKGGAVSKKSGLRQEQRLLSRDSSAEMDVDL